MFPLQADQGVLGYLGRALSLELSAVQMYSTQARVVASWGLSEPAERFRHEATEEMEHAERIIGRMLALGATPGASQLRPVQLGEDLLRLLQHNHAFEHELVKLYSEAAGHCARQGLHDDRLFFQTLMQEEQSHANDLVEWMRTLITTDDDKLTRTTGAPQ